MAQAITTVFTKQLNDEVYLLPKGYNFVNIRNNGINNALITPNDEGIDGELATPIKLFPKDTFILDVLRDAYPSIAINSLGTIVTITAGVSDSK